MIELDGISYTVKSPEENAYDLIDYLNQWFIDKDIRGRDGKVLFIKTNFTNPLYMLIFAVGYLGSILQRLVYSLGTGISIADASERQLLNLADMAGIKRSKATCTTIPCTVYAQSWGDVVIKSTQIVSVRTQGKTVEFHPLFDLVIPANTAGNIILGTETYGAFQLAAGTITEFDDPVDNMRKLVQHDSIPGQDQESIAGLRQRLQNRTIEGTLADRAADAIAGLPGVSMCNIYYNFKPTRSEFVGDVEVPPRQALLVVQGYNDKIAEQFYTYMICNTVATENAVTQYYITRAYQTLPVYITPPRIVPIFVQIYYSIRMSATDMDNIFDSLLQLSANLVIAQPVYTSDIINLLKEDYPDLLIRSVDLSKTGEDMSWSYAIIPEADQLLTFRRDQMYFVEAKDAL